MRVAVVGAGISGLAAARKLHQTGNEVIVYEKSRGVGGRIATRRQDGFVWDTGATSIAPRGKSLEQVMLNELDTVDLVKLDKLIYVHHALRPAPGDTRPASARYVYAKGNTTLPKLLAEGLNIKFNTAIDSVTNRNGKFEVADDVFDSIILTAPIPQSSLLLWGMQESRPTANVRYRSCISVNLGYNVPLPTTKYHALLSADQRHPLNWLSLESSKCAGRAPEGASALVAQLGAAYSVEHYRSSDAELVGTVSSFVAQLYGSDFSNPASSTVKRWKYSQPEGVAGFDEVNPPGSRLILASDGLLGGRVEDAYEIGLRAAELLS